MTYVSFAKNHVLRWFLILLLGAFKPCLHCCASHTQRPIHNHQLRHAVVDQPQQQSHVHRRQQKFEVSPRRPIYLLFPLPVIKDESLNPFGITIDLARPVVDIAVEDVYRLQIVEPGSLRIHFEDTRLSDAHGPNVAINHLVNNELDCIIGELMS